jgi:NAD(P)H dehydrogenase (quinone)
MSEQAYRNMLESFGLPARLALLIADADAKAVKGALYIASRDLSGLIGRPTTTFAAAITAALPR